MKYFPKKSMIAWVALVSSATVSVHASEISTGGVNIDKVLGELSRQHNNASGLVKTARQPASLALSSTLMRESAPKVESDDMLSQLSAVASNTMSKFKQSGVASWYGRQFHGQPTASGERFDMNAMTAAHGSLPLNCYIKVTNKDNGKSVIVKVNDRPAQANRMLDLSYGAAKAIGLTQKGLGNVSIERVDKP